MHLVLEIRNGPLRGQQVTVESGHTLKVGRSSRAGFVISDDTHISSLHFEVLCADRGCEIRDLNSCNGTWLNGTEISSAHIKHGDKVLAGETTFFIQKLHENGASVAPRSGEIPTKKLVMRAIFISYRRDDTEGEAGRLFDDLVGYFDEDSVFMDVAAIQPGRDFRKVIDNNAATCGVLLAVIGKDWVDAKDETGRRRLDNPNDWVRMETASALERDIPVIPVLVHDAKMPKPEQLPDDLKELAYRNFVELTHLRWKSDIKLLIEELSPYVKVRKGGAESPSQAKVGAEAEVKPPVTVGANARVAEVRGTAPVPAGVAQNASALPPKIVAPPPGLHWGILVAIVLLTLSLFNSVWAIVQAAWVRKVRPTSNAPYFMITGAVLWWVAILMYLTGSTDIQVTGLVINIVALVFYFIGVFSMKESIEDYYNTTEPIGLHLGVVMTFFFSVIYFQYCFTEIAHSKQIRPRSVAQRA